MICEVTEVSCLEPSFFLRDRTLTKRWYTTSLEESIYQGEYLVGQAVNVGLGVLPSRPHAAELRGGHHDAVDAAALRPPGHAAGHAAGQARRQPAKDAPGPRH